MRFIYISATVEANNKFGTQLGFAVSLTKKQPLGPNLAGVWLGENPKKFGTPTYIGNRLS